MELKIRIQGVEIELQEYNVDELEKLIDQMRLHGTAEKSLCNKLDDWLIKKKVRISFKTITEAIIQLSRWCNTEGKGHEGRKPTAIKISKLLFNKTLPRLD